MEFDVFQVNGQPLDSPRKMFFDYRMLNKFWHALGENPKNLTRKSVTAMGDGSLRFSYTTKRSIMELVSPEFDFLERLPEDLTVDFDVKPKLFSARLVSPDEE